MLCGRRWLELWTIIRTRALRLRKSSLWPKWRKVRLGRVIVMNLMLSSLVLRQLGTSKLATVRLVMFLSNILLMFDNILLCRCMW